MTTLRPLEETDNNEKGAHSSDDAKESTTASVPLDESYVSSSTVADEQLRLEKKIEKIRKKITKNSLEREADIEQYLNVINNESETAQMARLKQNFERKNKKYSQEAEQLQRKLEECEHRLHELENGADPSTRSAHPHRILQNVGHGISRTGVNLKGMAGSVITAPLDIAKSVKRNVFGSADNIPSASDEDKNVSGVGKSIFYDNTDYGPKKTEENRDNHHQTQLSEIPETRPDPESNRISQQFIEDSEHKKKLLQELLAIKQQNNNLQRNFDILKRESENEIRAQRAEIIDARFKIQQLEQNLNETMELYQNDVKQLKNDLNLIGTRMDYQYNDRFKKIEESVEGAQNRLYRMETSYHESAEKLLSAGQNWNSVALSSANIVVEVLKIILYVIAVVLDSIKPLTGTRKRAGIVLSGVVIFFIFWSFFGFGQLLGSLLGGNNGDDQRLPIEPKSN